MISYGKFKGRVPYISGDYSTLLQEYADDYIFYHDKEAVLNHFSLQSIISYFYRGDEEVHSQYYSKITKDDDKYYLFSASAIKAENRETNGIRALLFINEIEEVPPTDIIEY